jgi:hypothetical protein
LIDDTHAKCIHNKIGFLDQAGLLEPRGGIYEFLSCERAGRLTIQEGSEGALAYYPEDIDIEDARFISFRYRKCRDNPIFSLALLMANGERALWHETPDSDASKREAGGTMPLAKGGMWRHCVFDLKDLNSDFDGKKPLPRGRLRCLTVSLGKGREGDFVDFGGIALLSERTGAGGEEVVLAGRIFGENPVMTVRLTGAQFSRETQSEAEGWFCFAGVPRGEIIEVFATAEEERYYPVGKRIFEVGRSEGTIEIVV